MKIFNKKTEFIYQYLTKMIFSRCSSKIVVLIFFLPCFICSISTLQMGHHGHSWLAFLFNYFNVGRMNMV